jgi:hypothetical protein
MFSRVILIALTGFWVTMNVLLWRAEYGRKAGLGTSVPARVVWDKILTSPDSSSLTIWRNGKKIGFCHWITSVSEDLSRVSSNDEPPEGMVRDIVNYRLELGGNVSLSQPNDRLRFDSHLTLGRKGQWQAFDLRLTLRPNTWEIRSTAAERKIRLNWQDDTEIFTRSFGFSDLEHPEAIVKELGGPMAEAILSGSGLLSGETNQAPIEIHWDARHESIRLGHSPVEVYRLETHLLNRFDVVVFVSRAGEILRAELPEGIILSNDQLGGN